MAKLKNIDAFEVCVETYRADKELLNKVQSFNNVKNHMGDVIGCYNIEELEKYLEEDVSYLGHDCCFKIGNRYFHGGIGNGTLKDANDFGLFMAGLECAIKQSIRMQLHNFECGYLSNINFNIREN